MRDAEITEFQTALGECLAGTFEGTLEADEDRYSESKNSLPGFATNNDGGRKSPMCGGGSILSPARSTVRMVASEFYYEDSAGSQAAKKPSWPSRSLWPR